MSQGTRFALSAALALCLLTPGLAAGSTPDINEVLKSFAAATTARSDAAGAGDAPVGGGRTLNQLNRGVVSFLSLPVGLRNLIRTQAPSMRITVASSNTNGTTISLKDLTASLRQPPGNQTPEEAAAMAVDLATLGLLSVVFNTVSSLVYTVSGALATLGGAIGVGLDTYGTAVGRYQWLLSAQDFGATLYGDFNSAIDSSDYLGDAAKYIKMWNSIQSEIGTGQLQMDAQDQLAQLAQAGAMLQAITASTSK